MRCPKCGHRTVCIGHSAKPGVQRRRRECPPDSGGCGFRFTTEEKPVRNADGPLLFPLTFAGMGPRPRKRSAFVEARAAERAAKPTTEESPNG